MTGRAALGGPYIAYQLKHIGDFLVTLPALGLLKRHQEKTTVVVSPKVAPLAALHPWVDEVITLDRQGTLAHFWAVAQKIRRCRARTALIFDGQNRSALNALAAGLKNRAGGLYPIGRFYTHDLGIFDDDWRASQARRSQKMAALALGLSEAGPPLRPPMISLSESVTRSIAPLWDQLRGPGPRIGLALKGMQPEKSWPLANFVQLCGRLIQSFGASLFVTGGPDEKPLAQALAAQVGAHDFCGRTTLAELVALAQRADLFITIDTGASHLTALTETPLITIFTWTSPALWPPQSPQARLLCYDWALARFGLPEKDPRWRSAPVVTPDMVFEEAEKILNRGTGN